MNLKRIDAHSHVNLRAYRDDADAVIRRALDAGTGMLAVGTNYATSMAAVEVAEKYDGVWALVGLHPNNLFAHPVIEDEGPASEPEAFDVATYRALAKSSKKVVGIGECGLDYYRLPEAGGREEARRRQKDALRAHFELALELDLPVMLHCRDAHADLAAILEEFSSVRRPLHGNVHCFTGTWSEAQRHLALGLYVSFTGIITYPPRAAEKARGETLQDVVRHTPLDRMLIETDAPWLAPVPHRGERNEPAWVSAVGAQVAAIKGITAEEVERVTLENARRLFRLF